MVALGVGLGWIWVLHKYKGILDHLEYEMAKRGAPLPSLTDVGFLRREGYTKAIQDIHTWVGQGRTQEEQLLGIKIIEYLTRERERIS
jgi:hypothetical protein